MENTIAIEEIQESKSKRVLKTISWGLFALFCLLFFTLLRIPQTKITATLLGMVNQELAPMGYALSADEGKIKMGLGLYYELNGVKVIKTATQKALSFSKLELHPSIIAAIQGKFGGNIAVEEGEGRIHGSVYLKNQKPEADLKVESLNLGRIGVLPFLNPDLQGTAEVKGSIQIGEQSGQIGLELTRIALDETKIQGFQIPRIALATGALDIDIAQPNVKIKTFRLGRAAASDDLYASLKGDVKLAPYIDSSEANLRVELSLSPKLQQSFSLLDALLGQMKQKDGSYKFKLIGPLNASMPQPDT